MTVRCFAIIDTGNRPEHKKHPWDISRSSSMVTGNRSLENSHWLMEQPRRVSWETTGSLSRVGVAAPKECSGGLAKPHGWREGHHGGRDEFSVGDKKTTTESPDFQGICMLYDLYVYMFVFFGKDQQKKQFSELFFSFPGVFFYSLSSTILWFFGCREAEYCDLRSGDGFVPLPNMQQPRCLALKFDFGSGGSV